MVGRAKPPKSGVGCEGTLLSGNNTQESQAGCLTGETFTMDKITNKYEM